MKIKLERSLAWVIAFWAISSAVALADPVAVVSAKSKINSASSDEISNLFLGKSTQVAETHAVPYSLTDSVPVKEAFFSKYTGRSLQQIKSAWSRLVFTGAAQPLKEFPNTEALKNALDADPAAVGILDSSDVNASVKVIGK